MSMISELVEKLRVEAKSMGKYGTDYMATLLTRSADTIEMLSEKVRADRPQGEWIGYNADKEDWLRTDGTPIFLVCDKCHETVVSNASAHWNYCPNCGARMKGASK